MTYSAGNIVLAADYNGFAQSLSNVWGVGSTDSGWGQTTISNVVAGSGAVTATSWSTLVANLATAGSQTNSTLTSRTGPVTGNIISILANVATDITTVTSNRGNSVGTGSEVGYASGTTSKTTGTGSGQATWTITFTHTVTFATADAARYFWNAGGRVRLQYGKTSTGTDIDGDWNTFAAQPGSIYITGRVASAAQTINGVSYTGTTRIGGTGGTQTTLATTTGWYNLTGTPTTVFQLNNAASPYTGEYIRTTAASSATVLTLVTTWFQPAVATAGTTCNITGGTAPSLGAIVISPATAPTTLCTYFPPATTYLTASWAPGAVNPAIAATTA